MYLEFKSNNLFVFLLNLIFLYLGVCRKERQGWVGVGKERPRFSKDQEQDLEPVLLGLSAEAVLEDSMFVFCLEAACISCFLFTEDDKSHSTSKPGRSQVQIYQKKV